MTANLPDTAKPPSAQRPPDPPSLEVGDPVPDLGWLGPGGESVALTQSAHAGRLCVLYLCGSALSGHAARELTEFRDRHERFHDLGVRVFAVTADPEGVTGAIMTQLGLPFQILSDPDFAAGRALGLAREASAAGLGGPGTWPAATLIVGPDQRVLKRTLSAGEDAQAAAALSYCEAWAEGQTPGVITAQAPVLLVPNVLDPGHCARLIQFWQTGNRYEGGVASADHGRNVPIKDVKVRGDVALPDLGTEAQELFAIFRRRLFPEIRRAHNFRVTRAETLRIGCYAAAEGGHFIPHRDDTTPFTAHRRFAMSLNLNTGAYEGGYLRFPEYGAQLYQPGLGGAVVFSCSLLHEATPVTSGERFVLLGFFYGEAEQALRDRINAEQRAKAGVAASDGN